MAAGEQKMPRRRDGVSANCAINQWKGVCPIVSECSGSNLKVLRGTVWQRVHDPLLFTSHDDLMSLALPIRSAKRGRQGGQQRSILIPKLANPNRHRRFAPSTEFSSTPPCTEFP